VVTVSASAAGFISPTRVTYFRQAGPTAVSAMTA